jgi:hypothetical protein
MELKRDLAWNTISDPTFPTELSIESNRGLMSGTAVVAGFWSMLVLHQLMEN